MSPLVKSLLLAPVFAASLAGTAWAAPPSATLKAAPPANPSAQQNCLAAHAFLTALTTARDWIIRRDPAGVSDEKITGLMFRDAGMINVAVFQDGCLAMIVVVGKSPPDLKV